MSKTVIDAVKEARSSSKKRNFSQTFDLIVNVRLLDLKKPENRLSEIFLLPKGRGKDASIAVFSDNSVIDGVKTYNSSDIERFANAKREMKNLASSTEFFLSEPKLMPLVGKNLGRVLAPRGKMPSVLAGDVDDIVKRHKNSVRLKMKDSPVIQCMVGSENMSDEDIAANVTAILKFLEKKLPKGRNNIGKIMIKLTMGKPVRIEM